MTSVNLPTQKKAEKRKEKNIEKSGKIAQNDSRNI